MELKPGLLAENRKSVRSERARKVKFPNERARIAKFPSLAENAHSYTKAVINPDWVGQSGILLVAVLVNSNSARVLEEVKNVSFKQTHR